MYTFRGLTHEMHEQQDLPNFKPKFEIINFDDLDEAIEYANENYYKYHDFQVLDNETNDVEYSKKLADDEMDANDDMMFPDND